LAEDTQSLSNFGPTAMSTGSSRRALSIGLDVCGPIWKTGEKNDMVRFYLHPNMVSVVPQTGVVFISEYSKQMNLGMATSANKLSLNG